jgi:hypothetical protein
MKNVILYIPGSHGSFLKFLFDCYDRGKVFEFKTTETGNWHAMRSQVYDTVCFDMANDHQRKIYASLTGDHEEYRIVFNTLEDFYYILQCVIDRGGNLCRHSGIELLEQSLDAYEKEYKVKTTYRQTIKDLYRYNDSRVPRFILRNLFILIFITHFNHNCWKLNNEFKSHGSNLIGLDEILQYKKLKHRLDLIFGRSLDFQDVHRHLLENNKPYAQRKKVREIINAVETGKDISIQGLNIISEAYICFYFEKKHYSINFALANDFFKTTKDIKMYIDHYPSYMRKPNNLFLEHWKIYNVK